MSNSNCDYSNTVIYKICCKDPSITDVYVGHTTNFKARENQHKYSSKSILKNNLKLYDTIRNHGGWENWSMVQIAQYNCKDVIEARMKEQEYYTQCNATLNMIEPYTDKSILFCETCNVNCNSRSSYLIHLGCTTHISKENNNDEHNNNEQKHYFCDYCKFLTSNKKDYRRHLQTEKHMSKICKSLEKSSQPTQQNLYSCPCGKSYMDNSGLWRHKKKCTFEQEKKQESNKLSMLVQQNNELHKKLLDLIQSQNNIL